MIWRSKVGHTAMHLHFNEPGAARLLDASQSLTEVEKERVANRLGIPAKRLVIWAAENRHRLQAEVDWDGVSDSIRKLVAPNCCGEWSFEFCIGNRDLMLFLLPSGILRSVSRGGGWKL